MSFGVRDLGSEFSRPEFTRHLHRTVVFLQFKNDSLSDSSPLIQNEYDSRVSRMSATVKLSYVVQMYQASLISPCKMHAIQKCDFSQDS